MLGVAQHARDRHAVRAQRGLGLREAGVDARGQRRAQRGGQKPERLGGAVGGDDLVGVAAVEGGEGVDGLGLARVAVAVFVERGVQGLAQPGRRAAGDDVDRVVGVAGTEVGVAVVAQPLRTHARSACTVSGRPATTSSTRSAAAARRWTASPWVSSHARAPASVGTRPLPASSATTITSALAAAAIERVDLCRNPRQRR